MTGFSRLAVVDRGTAAIRCIAAVTDLNAEAGPTGAHITTVALHCDADRASWFVRAANEAVSLGVPTVGAITADAVMAALGVARADAVWLGAGPLDRGPELLRRCAAAGITVVGPGRSDGDLLTDDIDAKRLAQSLGIPTLPWRTCVPDDVAGALAAADDLGYPVLVRAGCRCTATKRVVAGPDGMLDALRSVADETRRGACPAPVVVERWVRHARQIDVQVVADDAGTVWILGVRDGSVQRRHEHVLVESSSTVLDRDGEAELTDAAVRLARAAAFCGVGSADFLVDLDTGARLFRAFHTCFHPAHAVTEATTSMDLVATAIDLARGGRLVGDPPVAVGHAVAVRLLAADPERGFAPAGGRLSYLRLPVGPGVRVDIGLTEGDIVDAEVDPLFATVVAHGRDRNEAFARGRRALGQLIVVIEGGSTTKAVLDYEMDAPAIVDGTYDCAWLDNVITSGDYLGDPHPLALLAAAAEVYEVEDAALRDGFLKSAARGRPSLPGALGNRVDLRLRGRTHRLRVYRTAPEEYRIDDNGVLVDIRVHRLSRYERAVSCGGSLYRVVLDVQEDRMHVEVLGVPHAVFRDDGLVVRADLPAFVVDVRVEAGRAVAAGDPLLVVESMKMSTTVTAPVDGVVTAVLAPLHTQVEAGAPLVRMRSTQAPVAESGRPIDLRPFATAAASDAPTAVHAQLRSHLLGFDLDPDAARRLPEVQRRATLAVAVDDPVLLAAELELVEIFTDISALSRREPDPLSGTDVRTASAQEYLFTFLNGLDPQLGAVPAAYLSRLESALARYGVSRLARTPELERAVVQMYRSFVRARELSWMVVAVLDRWLEHADVLVSSFTDAHRAALGRLVHVMPGRSDAVAELAREVHYRYVDQPLLERAASAADADVADWLTELTANPSPDRSETLIQNLVWCPRPLRPRLRDRYAGASAAGRERLLEVRTRRFYRIRQLQNLRHVDVGRFRACVADYDGTRHAAHLVSTYCAYEDLREFVGSLAAHLGAVAPDRVIVVDVETWRSQPRLEIGALADELLSALDGIDTGRPLYRLDVTVTSEGTAEEHLRTQHLSFWHDGRTFTEDERFRNLHPMIAKRLEIWRWSRFDLERLPSVEDVYVFAAHAKDNPADSRLVALAEVRDLTPAQDSSGRITGYPLLERMLCEAFTSIRHAIARRPLRDRPMRNRVVLYVRPVWDIPADTWRGLAHRLAPMSSGLGLEKTQVRVRLPAPENGTEGDAVIEVTGVAEGGVTVRVRPPSDEPIRPLTEYAQRVLKAERAGAPYPYELFRMLTPPPDAPSDFPAGEFREFDLADEGGCQLLPVDRPAGANTCGIVTGVLTSYTTTVPEGMSRVVLAGDPTRGLGNLAEAECRRIIGAIDLATERGVPLEWYALSSGARIAMDSGTENMDWIAAVLRRLIEFTQAGGEVNVVVTGINVGAQPYWNAEATMLMHTRGILVMTPSSAMVLTGKSSLDYSGGVSAEDNTGIGGFERVMGPNGQAQYWAPTVADACALLLQHYDFTYVVPGEGSPRRTQTSDPVDRDVRTAAHSRVDGCDFDLVGDVFSMEKNPDRKKPFDMRSVLHAVADTDCEPLERWARWRDAETAIVWDARIGGVPVCLLGIESRPLPRSRYVPADGPPAWTSGTLFPQSSRKLARAINAASGNRPLVVLANLSGFDGSPESMRKWQLEYGAEIGRAVTNFRGPIVFVVVSRYHGGAFVVFSKQLNEGMEIAAVEGSYASVIGGAPAAAVVFSREVSARTEQDSRVAGARQRLTDAPADELPALRRGLAELVTAVRAEKLKEVADEFDAIHDIRRAQRVGSVDLIVPARELRPYVIGALERGLQRLAPAPPVAQPV